MKRTKKRNEAERRGLRKKLRRDGEELKTHRDDIVADKNGAFGNSIREVEATSKAVAKPRESVLDADNFGTLTTYLRMQTNDLNSSDCTKPEIEVVVRGLRAKFSRNASFDWRAMGKASSVFFRRVPTMSLLLGPLDVEDAAAKVRRKRAPQQAKRPEQTLASSTTADEDDGDTSTKETMKRVDGLEKLFADATEEREKDTIEVHELLTQPASFGQTVENFFDFAYLVRWGKVGLRYDEDTGKMLAEKVEGGQEEATQADGGASATQQQDERRGVGSAECQAVVTLNIKQFRETASAWNLTQGMIKNRKT